jgi:hypothetical protein
MHNLRDPLSRNTAQILTRRIYRQPSRIHPDSSTFLSRHSLAVNQSTLQTRSSSLLSPFSSSTMPYDYHTDRSTLLFDHRSLPTIHRQMTLSNRRTHFARPSYIIGYPEPISDQNRVTRIDVWEHLAHTLRRPIPRDPPSTPDEPLPSRQLDDAAEPSTLMRSTNEKNEKKRTLRRPLRHSSRDLLKRELSLCPH